MAGNNYQALGVLFNIFGLIYLAMIALWVLIAISAWNIFKKAGEEGWKAIIPIYNLIVLSRIIGMEPLLLLIWLIPGGIGAIIWLIIAAINLQKAFGQDAGFALGIILLPYVFLPILAFGKAQYVLGQPAAAAQPAKPSVEWPEGTSVVDQPNEVQAPTQPIQQQQPANAQSVVPPVAKIVKERKKKPEDPWLSGN